MEEAQETLDEVQIFLEELNAFPPGEGFEGADGERQSAWLRRRLGAVRRDRERLRLALDKAWEELRTTRQAVADLNQAQLQIQAGQEDLRRTRAELREAREQLQQVQDELGHRDRILQDIYASRSWRLANFLHQFRRKA